MLYCNCEKGFLPELEGSLVGYVYTFDEFANLLEDHSKVVVSAFGMQRVYQTRTDASGRFELMNLPVGTYELHFEKPGFGTMKQFGIQHLGGTPTILGLSYVEHGYASYAIFIYQLPTTEILSLSIENDTLIAEFVFSGPEPENIGLHMYFSTETGFALDHASYITNLSLFYSNGKYQCEAKTDRLPFSQGVTIYYRASVLSTVHTIRARGYNNIYGTDSYVNCENNSTIYPNLGDDSPEFSFILQE